jgi:nucleotide-binding universal stress UspA family protein
MAAAAGYPCLIDDEHRGRELLEDAVARLKSRGIKAYAHLARGAPVPTIVGYSKKLAADLIVVGHYPTAEGRRWWTGPEHMPLAELVDCCLFVAVSEGS